MIKCFATTNSVMIDPLGKVRPCCKFDGHFGHIDEYDSIDDILKSEHYTKLRNWVLPNKWKTYCKYHIKRHIPTNT